MFSRAFAKCLKSNPISETEKVLGAKGPLSKRNFRMQFFKSDEGLSDWDQGVAGLADIPSHFPSVIADEKENLLVE